MAHTLYKDGTALSELGKNAKQKQKKTTTENQTNKETQVDFPAGQATFLAYLSTGQNPRQATSIQPQKASWISDFF